MYTTEFFRWCVGAEVSGDRQGDGCFGGNLQSVLSEGEGDFGADGSDIRIIEKVLRDIEPFGFRVIAVDDEGAAEEQGCAGDGGQFCCESSACAAFG